MNVAYVGEARGAGPRRRLACATDVVTMEDIDDDDIVAILTLRRRRFCYDLHALARWFLERSFAHGALPTLPQTREPVPARVYAKIVGEARRRIVAFRAEFDGRLAGLTAARRSFLVHGRTRSRPAQQPPPPMTIDLQEMEDLLVDGYLAEHRLPDARELDALVLRLLA